MRRNLRIVTVGCGLLLAAGALPGCHNLIDPPGGARTAESADGKSATLWPTDAVGDMPIPNKVQIAAVDRSMLQTTGTVVYRIDNVSNTKLESLTWSVTFSYPPPKTAGFDLPFQGVPTPERELELLATDRGIPLEITCPEFEARRGQEILSTQLTLRENLPTLVVARMDGSPGTTFFNGQLECVGHASPEDIIDADTPTVWVSFENRSSQLLSGAEVNVTFLDMRMKPVGDTGWQPIPNIRPGEAQRVDLKLPAGRRVTDKLWVRTRYASW